MIEFKEELLTEEMRARIRAGFRQYAIETVGLQDRGDLITFTAYDASGPHEPIFAGVVCVQLFWGQLHIKYVFVDAAYRKKGIGSKLIEDALNYGRAHNCTFTFVETMSFQAPEFYQKLGFVLELTREGFTNGICYHYLKRDL